MLSVRREVEADEAVQVALSTSALSQCFKGRGEMKAGDMSSLIESEDGTCDLCSAPSKGVEKPR